MSQQEQRPVERELKMSEAMVEAIATEMRDDEAVFYMGEDVADYGGIFDTTEGLLEEFGHDRVRTSPSARQPTSGRPSAPPRRGCAPSRS